MLLLLTPPPVLSTWTSPACVQKSPGQNMALPLGKLFPHCYFLLPVLPAHTAFSAAVTPSTIALSFLTLGSHNPSFQSSLESASIPCVLPLAPCPNPSCFQHPTPSSNLTPTSTQTTLHPHHPAYLSALPSTLTRSFAAPKTPIPPTFASSQTIYVSP